MFEFGRFPPPCISSESNKKILDDKSDVEYPMRTCDLFIKRNRYSFTSDHREPTTWCCGLCESFEPIEPNFELKTVKLLCGMLGCNYGSGTWSNFFAPFICCFAPTIACGKDTGCGANCCNLGCFLGTQSQVCNCCISQCGNRNIDKKR